MTRKSIRSGSARARIAAAAARNDSLILDMLAYGRLSHTALPCGEHSLEASVQTVLQSQSGDITAKKAIIQIKSQNPQNFKR